MKVWGWGCTESKAGLFISDNTMQYVSLRQSSGRSDHALVCLSEPFERRSSGGDFFADQESLAENLKRLKAAAGGKWADEVYLGIQSKDVSLRTVDMPSMDPADAKDAFQFEYDRFFSVPRADAVYDLARIDYPRQGHAEGKQYYLVVSARVGSMESLFRAAARLGARVACIEPGSLAALRCMMGPSAPMGCSLCVIAGATASTIIVVYNGNGIIFRGTTQIFLPNETIADKAASLSGEILSTLQFSRAQIRGFHAEKIFLGGCGAGWGEEFQALLSDATSLPVIVDNPWEKWEIDDAPEETFGWETALGLALREETR